MATLIETAQRVQDLYEQNYTPNDKFLDIDDFKFEIAVTYSSLLNAMYQNIRRENKQMDGFSNIEIPGQWLYEEQLTIEKDPDEDRHIAKTKYPVYAFDFDNAANALQGIHSFGGKHCIYRKISLNERRFRGVIPPIGAVLFYLNNSNEIVFWGASDGSKVKVQYIPKVVDSENDCILSDNIISAVIDVTLDRMFKAREGKFVQKLDNQNPNVIPQQQVDPSGGR